LVDPEPPRPYPGANDKPHLVFVVPTRSSRTL